MEAFQELLGSVAFFALFGAMLSIVLGCYYESKEKQHLIPHGVEFWDRLAKYTFTAVLAFGISIILWMLIAIINWAVS